MMPAQRASLMKAGALSGLRVAISVSQSEDLSRLGLAEIHFRLALGEIARSVIVGGGHLAYGGHLDPNGYTVFLVQELQRYSRRDRPLRIYLAWQEHRRLPIDSILSQKQEIGLFGDVICLDPNGVVVAHDYSRGIDPPPPTDASTTSAALTAMRQYMTQDSHARILIGGKRRGFQGSLPGLLEEAIISVKAGRPLYLVGGLGGATLDMIGAVSTNKSNSLPPLPSVEVDNRMTDGLTTFRGLIADRSWNALDNGLSASENELLASTPRPSEIAALISLGLGRRFKK